VRLERLLTIFFDCYLGYLQRQNSGQPDIYESLIREPWQRRFRKFKTYQPTHKKLLCGYSGVIDYSMRLNNYWMSKVTQKVTAAEGKTREYLTRELGEFLQTLQKRNMPGQVQTPTDLLKAVLGYIKLTSSEVDWNSRVDLNNEAIESMWDMVDLMNEITQAAGGRPALGGAALIGAQTLATLGETAVNLLIPFVSENLLGLLATELIMLWYDPKTKKLWKPTVKQFQAWRASNPKASLHPEIRNFIIEFSASSPIIYCACCGGSVVPNRTDRVIVRNRYSYYVPKTSDFPSGNVDRVKAQEYTTRLKVKGLFGFDSGLTNALSLEERQALAEGTAQDRYAVFLLSGLQSLDKTTHRVTEKELKLFTDQGTKIHIEVAGTKNLDWLTQLIPSYIFSVSIGEELEALYQAAKMEYLNTFDDEITRAAETRQFERREADASMKPRDYQKVIWALEAAKLLNLERLYFHGLDMDIIVRNGDLNEKDRFSEIQADLIAKWVVLRKLMSRGEITLSEARDTMTQIKEEGFASLIETAKALYQERLGATPDFELELYGKYFAEYERTVILVPIRWVYGAMQDQLRIVGAGDTTSIVSAVQVI
jgi:hypothetical protein